ncbi:SDR family NAD(P)-dependent oxidoreductase [Candidatus Enterococcus ferrettii]|uniref:SDR family oxidoreductase n=1 Tax=Candidatus Enterococcus ferrettii TaxID=2815324 RepID=A0ABV0ET61_9ENTE|nr:SDR family oxidoreductase [Enterococcus sp. 665A]MBO1343126.1 SDR family oxidoreductase [Enterococcus sp. 665A]
MTETALITGTTSGIGYELCHQFASNKTNLVLVSRSEAKLLKQKQDLEKLYGIQVEIISYDLTKSDAVESIIRQLNEKKFPIDYLVNNAGFNEVGNFLHTELDNELDMIQLHVTFITKLTKYLLHGMIERNYGRILNIASTGSYIPCPHNIVYTATKAYLLSFTKGLAAELENTGVTITAVCPGATKTNFPKRAGIDQTLLFNYFVMHPKLVAAKSYQALMGGKKVKIIGLYNKLLVFSAWILPKQLINQLSLKMIE